MIICSMCLRIAIPITYTIGTIILLQLRFIFLAKLNINSPSIKSKNA